MRFMESTLTDSRPISLLDLYYNTGMKTSTSHFRLQSQDRSTASSLSAERNLSSHQKGKSRHCHSFQSARDSHLSKGLRLRPRKLHSPIAEPDKLSVDGEGKITFHPSLSGYRSAGLCSNRASRHPSHRVSGSGGSAPYLGQRLDGNSNYFGPKHVPSTEPGMIEKDSQA